MVPYEDSEFFLSWFSYIEKTRGDQFENLMRWWLVNDNLIQSTYNFVKVIRFADWEERTHTDLGTDLVAWDKEDRRYAIQCKTYNYNTKIGKSDLSQIYKGGRLKQLNYPILMLPIIFGPLIV